MRSRLTRQLGALAAGAALIALAGTAAADTAKLRPQMRANAGTKSGCPSAPGDPATSRALNPQPEPPSQRGVKKPENPAVRKGFNPQPEPPAKRGVKKRLKPGTARGFNPQPEPPAKRGTKRPLKPGTVRGFNPQPEPPADPC